MSKSPTRAVVIFVSVGNSWPRLTVCDRLVRSSEGGFAVWVGLWAGMVEWDGVCFVFWYATALAYDRLGLRNSGQP